MCGIAGYFSFRPDRDVEPIIRRMTQTMLHRGPDESNYRVLTPGQSAVGQTRLSIIDLEKGKQPFVSDGAGNVLVYNGELYNYRELRRELQAHGVRFATDSDTEVLLKSYEHWGLEFLNRLSGMFAFILWDRQADEFLVARDRYGIKPLYYYLDDACLVVASEVKAILASEKVAPRLNEANLLMQLCYGHTIDDSCIFRHIRCVAPGGVAIYRRGAWRAQTYYNIEDQPFGSRSLPLPDAQRTLQELMAGSIRRHLIADVKVVTSLSGGLDSSIVTSLAGVEQPIEAFSLGYGRDDDEIPFAEKVARRSRLPFHNFTVNVEELNRQLHKLLYHLEEPLPHTQISTTFFASAFVKNSLGAKVCLLGEGADEILGGYNYPKMARELKSAILGKRYVYKKYKEMFFNLLPGYRGKIFHTHNEEAFAEFYEADRKRYAALDRRSCSGVHFVMLCDFKHLLPNSQLNRVDKLYMAHSIEARVPFLDPEVVEFVWSLPVAYRIGPPEKKLAREAFRDMLPEEVARREKFGKQGSQNPFATWWKGGLQERLQREIRCGLAERNLFDPAFLSRALAEKLPHSIKVVMTLGFLEILLKMYADRDREYLHYAQEAA